MTTTVHYWPPHGGQVGHVSVEIASRAGDCYISWWPADGTKQTGFSKMASVVWGVDGEPFTFDKDMEGEGHRKPISTVLSGLDEAKMIKWWNEVFEQDQWSLLNQSCAQIAVDALREGGADRFINTVSGWLASWQATYWKPMEVHVYAQHVLSGMHGQR